MTVRLDILGGSDFADDAIPAADINDTLKALDGALGEVKMFALSMTGAVTKATLQTRGWAICDGTTPASQGISSPTITTTPDLQDKFIKMSNDETSGTTGGAATHKHIQSGAVMNGSALRFDIEYGVSNGGNTTNGQAPVTGATIGAFTNTNNDRPYTETVNNEPPYYEVAFFMKVKV